MTGSSSSGGVVVLYIYTWGKHADRLYLFQTVSYTIRQITKNFPGRICRKVVLIK